MTRQLLRESTVVIDYNDRVLELKALSSISGSTSLGQTTGRRKTLFANSPKQYSITSKINPTQINLSVPVTDSFSESLFLELVGLDGYLGIYSVPVNLPTKPKMCGITLFNTDSVMRADNCFVESVSLSLSKSIALTMDIVLNASGIEPIIESISDPAAQQQGAIVAPGPVLLTVANKPYESVISATISIQQVAEWVDDKNLFSVANEETYKHTEAQVQDLILSSTVVGNYLTKSTLTNVAIDGDVILSKSGFNLHIEDARVVHNLDIQSIYQYRLDVAYTETSGRAKLYFGE
ncbi:base plate tail tube protein [Vibrio phage D239]